MLKRYGIACLTIALTLTGCDRSKTPDGGTDTATAASLCRTWGESLPTRSRSDTAVTKIEIGETYADFAVACPDFIHLIPGGPQ